MRTAPCIAMVAGIPEHKIRVVSPDIGGGFGNKVGIYPGYILAVVGSIVTGKPVKWVEDRSENLMSTSFARDYLMRGEIAATKDGKILALRTNVLADHGAFNATAQPTKTPAGFFSIFTGSYDLQAAYCKVTGVYTNKAPGGVAYACSFRVTEAVYLVERMVDVLARKLEMDPAELRLKNFIRPEQFPYANKTGWEYDSGNYEPAMRLSMKMAGYEELRREQAEKRERGELMGIGVSFFTETVGAGPRKHFDIVGLGMADGAELRIHPTGKAVVRLSVQSQGQGHETTFAQIVAEELGIPPEDIDVVHGDTDQTPFGLGTYGSRSTPVSGGAVALVARKVREKAKFIAAAMLETRPEDLEWEKGRWFVKGDPGAGKTMAEIALGAHGTIDLARRNRRQPRRRGHLRPAESDVPVRRLHLRGRRRPRHRPRESPPLHCRGRLRHPDQPDDHRRPGPRRPDRRRRDGADGDHRIRRGRQLPGRLLHGLSDPHGDGGSGLGDRFHRHAVAAPSHWREGHRRIRHGRVSAGHRQRRRRRAGAVWNHAYGHAVHPRPRLGGHAGPAETPGVTCRSARRPWPPGRMN